VKDSAVRCGSYRGAVDSRLPPISLADEPVGPTIDGRRNFLLCAYGRLCGRRHNCILPPFSKGGPLSSVPAILAGGAAIMAIAGILFFREPPSWQRIAGIAFAIIGLLLLRR